MRAIMLFCLGSLTFGVAAAQESQVVHAPERTLGAANPMTLTDVHIYRFRYLSQPNQTTEAVTALRNMLMAGDKSFYLQSQNAVIMQTTANEASMAEQILRDFDVPRVNYRLTYTLTEKDNDKTIGVQHSTLVIAAGVKAKVQNGSRVPVNNTYYDLGVNIDASLTESKSGVEVQSHIDRSSVVEGQSSSGGLQMPVIRHLSLEGTTVLVPSKPVLLGSLDVPGSTRHIDVDVMMEPVK